jgi:protein-disulfide isomerase
LILKSRCWSLAVVVFAVAIAPAVPLARQVSRTTNLPEAALREKMVNYLHQYGFVSPEIPIQVGACESSQDPAYYECQLTVNASGKVSTPTFSISRNGRLLAMSPMYYLGPDTPAEILRNVRVRFKLGTEWQLSDGPLESSPVPGFLETTVTAERNGKKQSQVFYVTADKRFAVLGQLFVIRSPKEIERMINTQDQPHSGPLNAPVTIVEYADLECPMCAHLQPFLENELLPRYGNKVRLIYKDFPLPEHDWSREAAIANQCAFQIDPPAFASYRTSIFAHQAQINITNVRDMLLQLGEQVGIDRLRLAACLDAKTTLSRVEADYNEATRLQVSFTPTCFIDGQPVVGAAPAQDYYRIIDNDLKRAK